MTPLKRGKDGYHRKVDNKMHSFGDTDLERKIIRVNKSKKKNKQKGDIINTIIHEEMHAKHPLMHEYTVRKKTEAQQKLMSATRKLKLYSLYK